MGDRSGPGDRDLEAERGDIDRLGDLECSETALRERECDLVGERPREALRERMGAGERESDGMIAGLELKVDIGCSRSVARSWTCHGGLMRVTLMVKLLKQTNAPKTLELAEASLLLD